MARNDLERTASIRHGWDDEAEDVASDGGHVSA